MRATPAFQLTIRHFGVWRAMVAVLVCCAAASLGAFLMLPGEPSASPLIRGPLATLAALAIAAGATLWRREPVSLRWDTQQWHLGPAASKGEEPWPGQLAVALDLGAWMLLKFSHQRDARRPHWLPVQRMGIEPSWHALRCAVYCARPADSPDGGRNRATSPESQE